MSTQPEALRLADALEVDKWHISGITAADCAAELRRLHELNQDLLEALEVLCEYAEISNDCQRGVLSTRFVREVTLPAIAKARGEK